MSAPVTVIQNLVADFQAGRRDSTGFVSGLEVMDGFLEDWYESLDSLSVPAQYSEGIELKEAARQGLEMLAQAVAELRLYAENLDEESLAAGLECGQQGQKMLSEVKEIAEANAMRLEDEI